MLACGGVPGISGMACDTDGIDGVTDAAGAWFDGQTLAAAMALGLDPADALRRNDAGGFFATLDHQVITGPTRTNVNDFRAVLIDPWKRPAEAGLDSGACRGKPRPPSAGVYSAALVEAARGRSSRRRFSR